MLNNYCGFDIGCSYVSELIVKVSTRGWHICLLQCHNNLSLMLCIMHELKMNYSPIKPNLKINITKQRHVRIGLKRSFQWNVISGCCFIHFNLTSMNIVQRFDSQGLVHCSFSVQEKNCFKSILYKMIKAKQCKQCMKLCKCFCISMFPELDHFTSMAMKKI